MSTNNKLLHVSIDKALASNDPLLGFFTNQDFDAMVQSKTQYKSLLQGPWAKTVYTSKEYYNILDVRHSVAPSKQGTLAQRNMTGAHMDASTGGISPMAAASSSVGLVTMTNNFSVTPAEVQGRKMPPKTKGITLNPTATAVASMAALSAEKLAEIVDHMSRERDKQALHVLTRGTMPCTDNPDNIVIDWKKIQKAQVGVYELPKPTKRISGTVACFANALSHLRRAAEQYLSGDAEYILVCNTEFLQDILTDPILLNAFTSQQMSIDVNPLFTGSIMPLFASIRAGGATIRIVEDNVVYSHIARKSDGSLESIDTTALPRMATTGTDKEKNIYKAAKPAARMICISPNQYLNVVGLLHGAEDQSVGQRVAVEKIAFGTIIKCLVEYTWLPVSLLPFLAIDFEYASGDDAGIGKLKKMPTVYNKTT